MDYTIIKENKDDFKNIENLKNIEVPYIPIEIMEMFINDYKFMKKFLEYKRDGTLALLKIYNAIIIYDDNFKLNTQKTVKDWKEFFELINNYAKIFTYEGLNFYKNKEKNELNNNFVIIDEKLIGTIMRKVFDNIYKSYLKKFPYWPESPGEQNNYINIEFKNQTDINNIRYYWHLQGIMFIQDTKYEKPIKGNSFKVEFKGDIKFQIASFDLNKLEYLRKNEKNLKQYIDIIDDKIIDQNLHDLNLEFDLDN